MAIPFKSGIVAWLWVCTFAIAGPHPADDFKTLRQLQQEAIKNRSARPQSAGPDSRLRLAVAAPVPVPCPSPAAVDLLRHEIAYERTEDLDPLTGLGLIHTRVWDRGPLTAFYVDQPLATFPRSIRLAYLVGADGARGSFSCSVEQDWRKCVEKSVGPEAANNLVRTCTAAVDLRAIPAWRPSPNGKVKRRVADELRREIEAQWPAAQEIVIRDFNLKDRQITIYLKTPDGDYFQGCGFHAMREPHCEGWHLFGHAPVSSLRKRVFEMPYRLK